MRMRYGKKSTRLAWEVNRRGLSEFSRRKSTNQWRAALDWLWMARRFYYVQSVIIRLRSSLFVLVLFPAAKLDLFTAVLHHARHTPGGLLKHSTEALYVVLEYRLKIHRVSQIAIMYPCHFVNVGKIMVNPRKSARSYTTKYDGILKKKKIFLTHFIKICIYFMKNMITFACQ